MNEKQKKFCDNYLKSGDIKQASIYAGYKEKTGERLIKNIEIENYIKEKILLDNLANIADSNEIMECLTDIMRGKEKIHKEDEKPIKEITVKERLKAAELLGKAYAIFSPKQENTKEEAVIILGNAEIVD